jgi:hypothetical protein
MTGHSAAADGSHGAVWVRKWTRRSARILSVPIIAYALFMFVAHLGPGHEIADYPPVENLLPVLITGILFLVCRWRAAAGSRPG